MEHATNLSTEDFQRLDADHHWHPFTDTAALNEEGSRIITKADGVWLWDSEGNRILDGMAGLWCVQVGYGRREIADAVHRQMLELPYYNTFFKSSHPPAAQLAAKLAELAPAGLDRVFFTNSGSEANDTALRMARHYWAVKGKPEKRVIIGRTYGYHGSTVAASALGGMEPMHEQAGTLPDIYHIMPPYQFAYGQDQTPEEFGITAANALEEAIIQIGADNIAAFIAEPIQGAGGVIIPPDNYWTEIKKVLARHDILLTVDEVICGFGRTGNWFASQTFDLAPDLMPIAKGLSSGYLPIGGVMVGERVSETLIKDGGEFFHGFTYSGHPAACAAALANLEIMEREKIIDYVRDDIGPYLRDKWLALGNHPLVGEARMCGLVGALELVPNKSDTTQKFADEWDAGTIARDLSLKNGLVMRAVRSGMIISPPLVLTRNEANELIARAEKTLDDAHSAFSQQGLLG